MNPKSFRYLYISLLILTFFSLFMLFPQNEQDAFPPPILTFLLYLLTQYDPVDHLSLKYRHLWEILLQYKFKCRLFYFIASQSPFLINCFLKELHSFNLIIHSFILKAEQWERRRGWARRISFIAFIGWFTPLMPTRTEYWAKCSQDPETPFRSSTWMSGS